MTEAVLSTLQAARARAALDRGLARLDALRPVQVVGASVLAVWAATLALALVVRHNGFVYYQGGDQLWSYTLGYLLAHGQLGQPLVGYLWSALVAPLALVAGPNLASALPAIVVVDTVVLLPVALAAFYGLARLIGGRRFAAFAMLVWLVTPFIGVLFTNAGYHQRYTELLLPQAFGLTAMTDFPTMVAALVSAYFAARVVWDGRDVQLDALAAGAAAGVAVGLKPSTVLFLAGPVLAFALARRFGAVVWTGVAFLPSVIVLAVWKYRGYGYLPLIHSGVGEPVRSAAGPLPVGLPQYVSFDWAQFERQLDLLREHFWSGRVVEWLIVAGLIGVGRRSLPALGLVGGWFLAFALAKGGYGQFSIEDSSLLRVLIPTIPAFVLLLASLPFLLPRSGRPWGAVDPGPRAPRRLRVGGVAAALVLTTLVPLAAVAAASPLQGERPDALVVQQPLLPATVDVGLEARRSGDHVRLTWKPVHSVGGALFYHVYRADATNGSLDCDHSVPAVLCQLKAVDLGATTTPSFDDRPPAGDWEYRVGVSANWLNDPTLGDVYELTRAVRPR